MFLYVYCIFALVINNKIRQNQRNFFEISTLIMLCIVSGTRYYLGGTDYHVYKIVFDGLPTIKEFLMNYFHLHEYYITLGFEPGYLFLNSIVKTLGFNFFGFTLVNSIVFYTCLYLGLKKYTYNFNILIIVFLYKLFFYNTFISMRQSITVGIFFLAMTYIEKKKPFKYFTLSLIAISFHNGALILFPIYFISRFKISKNKLILLNVIFIPTILASFFNLPVMRLFDFVIGFFKNPVAIDKANNLINGVAFSSIGIFHTLEYFLIMFLLVIYFDKIIEVNEHSEFILKLFIILLPVFTLFRGYEILTRIKDYFTLTYGIILGYLCLINNGKYRDIVQIGTIIVCAYGFFRFIILFDGGALMPYETYILKEVSIFRK
ncbi:EpsG family protein [Clostridium sp. DL1XJH146]